MDVKFFYLLFCLFVPVFANNEEGNKTVWQKVYSVIVIIGDGAKQSVNFLMDVGAGKQALKTSEMNNKREDVLLDTIKHTSDPKPLIENLKNATEAINTSTTEVSKANDTLKKVLEKFANNEAIHAAGSVASIASSTLVIASSSYRFYNFVRYHTYPTEAQKKLSEEQKIRKESILLERASYFRTGNIKI